MRIANPLYDHAFKYLMSNERLARKVLSVILDKEVISVELSQQEIILEDEERQFTMYRLDFKAQIRDQSGKVETVLVELQKSKLPTNELRFRSYLGHAYLHRNKQMSADGIEYEIAWPIISIYIMGYNLPDIPAMAVKVDQRITDLSSRQLLELESDFIALLTHDCYILQVRRLPGERRTRIERFMTLFNQAWVKEANYILDLEDVPEEFKDIAEYLQLPLLNDEMRKKLQAEQAMEDLFVSQETRIKQLEVQKEAAEAKAEEERKSKEAAEAKAEEERQKNEKIQQDFIKMVELLLQSGKTIEEIAVLTGRTAAELHHMVG
ncbi:MAG TPA: hypothetical protein PKA00_15430 [Saprospiraceae bacterium]|nr:hypothetical protein [Saprospiraceae bacterium]HMQ84304.1 hypothetical protein [Saprospiraceae bacterium]